MFGPPPATSRLYARHAIQHPVRVDHAGQRLRQIRAQLRRSVIDGVPLTRPVDVRIPQPLHRQLGDRSRVTDFHFNAAVHLHHDRLDHCHGGQHRTKT